MYSYTIYEYCALLYRMIQRRCRTIRGPKTNTIVNYSMAGEEEKKRISSFDLNGEIFVVNIFFPIQLYAE